MNPNDDPLAHIDQESLFARAEDIRRELEERVMFMTVVHGGKSVTDVRDDANSQRMIAEAALQKAVIESATPLPAPPRPKGPARRKARKPDARRRQRQARKASR